MKPSLLIITLLSIITHSITPQLTKEEQSIIKQQFRCESYFENIKKQLYNANVEELQCRLEYLLAFMKQTGEVDNNVAMPELGLSNAADFFAILYIHPNFTEHKERSKFLKFSQILAQRSKHFLQIMRQNKRCSHP